MPQNAVQSLQSLDLPKSAALFDSLITVVPDGYNSVARRRPTKIAFTDALGAHMTDVDGNVYVDCVMALGPAIVGHGEPTIVEAIKKQADHALALGTESPLTLEAATRLKAWIPNADYMIFASSGTEAVQHSLRIARATTGRTRVVRFEGHYHGWMDPMHTNLPVAGPAAEKGSVVEQVDGDPGQISSTDTVIVTKWNDCEALDAVIAQYGDEIAALIMEPIPCNFGAFTAAEGYLEYVREVCDRAGILLIFDEVVSGFRLSKGGAQELLGVKADLAVFAKGIGGGLPVSMVAGTKEAMSAYFEKGLKVSGTFNANPLGMAAVNAATTLIDSLPDLYERLDAIGLAVQEGLQASAAKYGHPLTVNRVGSVLQLLWDVDGDAKSFRSCATTDRKIIAQICDRMLTHGVHALTRGIIFLSYRHTEADIRKIVDAFERSMVEVVGL